MGQKVLFLINSGYHGGISGIFVNEISCFILCSVLIQSKHRSSIILNSISTEEFNIITNGKQQYHLRRFAQESPEIFQAHYGNYSQQCRSNLRVRRDMKKSPAKRVIHNHLLWQAHPLAIRLWPQECIKCKDFRSYCFMSLCKYFFVFGPVIWYCCSNRPHE